MLTALFISYRKPRQHDIAKTLEAEPETGTIDKRVLPSHCWPFWWR
ncbi:hypothetical protein PCI56_01805 [Plesiomonas shigelloides subsp. oncorhynchi]|nr:hypothetical protein [Plesiomonas shigelloides]